MAGRTPSPADSTRPKHWSLERTYATQHDGQKALNQESNADVGRELIQRYDQSACKTGKR